MAKRVYGQLPSMITSDNVYSRKEMVLAYINQSTMRGIGWTIVSGRVRKAPAMGGKVASTPG